MKVELIEPDYTGIAMVLCELEKIYHVTDNKKLIDDLVKNIYTQKSIISETK